MRVLLVLTLVCGALLHVLLGVLYASLLRFIIGVLWPSPRPARSSNRSSAGEQARWAA